MKTRNFLRAAGAFLLAAPIVSAQAAPGDMFVPAHRTRDGHFVPPNVPPLSAGTHPARRPGKGSLALSHSRSGLPAPIFVEARDLRR